MKIKIKKFEDLSTSDLYEILRLRTEVFVVEQECAYQECDGKDYRSFHLTAEEGEEIIAYLRIVEKGISFNEISIGRVVVDSKHRGRGIARELLEYAIEFIETELGEKKIRIAAQEYLEVFYESLGFSKVSDTYMEDGIPHIDMVLTRNNTVD